LFGELHVVQRKTNITNYKNIVKNQVKVKVNQSHYRPGVAQRVPGS
jgi:hypothetical protein